MDFIASLPRYTKLALGSLIAGKLFGLMAMISLFATITDKRLNYVPVICGFVWFAFVMASIALISVAAVKGRESNERAEYERLKARYGRS